MKKFTFYAQAGDSGNPIVHEEVFEFDDDTPDSVIDEELEQFMWERVSPEFWKEEAQDD